MYKNFYKNTFRFLLIVLTIIQSSCIKENDHPFSKNNIYLTNYDYIRTIDKLEVDFNMTYLSTLYSDFPEIENIKNEAVYSIDLYVIAYNTTFQGDDKIASGLVCIPNGNGPFPILSFQNGTNTLHSKAPSVDPNDTLFKFLESVASTGFIIVIPDYLGFGDSDDMFHPYLDKSSTVQSVVDMLLATKELINPGNLDINANNNLFITGYSQGGWATLHLQHAIETNYQDEFNLKATSCGAGPYNLLYISTYILGLENYPMPYFLGYIYHSYKNLEYIDKDYSDIFNEPYASRIPLLYDGTKDADYINSQLTTSVSELLTENFRNGFFSSLSYQPLKSTLLDNSVEAWNIQTPLQLLHGEGDTFVPSQVSENMYADFIEAGVNENKISYTAFPGVGHTDGIIPSGIKSIGWFLELK